MAIGRLDEDSEGLVFLTTDGKLSEFIRSRKIEKEYYAQVDGLITEEALEKLRQGVGIVHRSETYQTLPCKAFKVETVPDFPVALKR